jgi:hypothetical protein
MTYPKDANGRYLIPAEGPGAGAGYRKDATMHTTLTAKATPAEAAELQDRLERGCAKAWAAAREAGAGDPWGSGHAARIQTALECHQVAADVVHETLASGMRRPAESTADFLTRTTAQAQAAEAAQAGPGTTGQLIRAPAGAGPARGTTARHQEEKAAAGLQTDAQATDRQTGTRQDAGPAGTGERDLTELDEAGLTPGAPHPDPALAAKGWRVCDHGIYTRRPDGHLQAEPQAC